MILRIYYEVLPILCKVLPRYAKAIEYYQVLLMLCKVCQNYQVVQRFAKLV
jgi:hypothetical protein